jgi:pimeloyl-ACP methyl ester carboxylesterase
MLASVDVILPPVMLAPGPRLRNVSRRAGAALAVLLAVLAPPARAADLPDLRCDQEPGNRFFWTEWGFCDLAAHGPERARGIVIWNHGISGTSEQYKAPPAAVFRLLHARGWDVLKIARNNLGETSRDLSLSRATERTEAEIRAQRARGYRRIVLAGQSFGGYITLETASGSRDVFAAVAMAPGVTSRGGVARIDPSITERLLQESKAARMAVVFPPGDALFDNRVRGPGALRILSRRGEPFLLVDESSTAISGHGGGTGSRFALRYGPCLADFLSAESTPGRFTCPEGREGEATRDLLLGGVAPRIVPEAALPAGWAPFNGLWFGLLGDTLVVTGIVQDGSGTPSLLYRALATRSTGGVYAARVEEGRLSATLGSAGSRAPSLALTAGTGSAVEVTWTSADGQRVLRGRLAPLRLADSARADEPRGN